MADFALCLRPQAAAIAQLADEMPIFHREVAEGSGSQLLSVEKGFDV